LPYKRHSIITAFFAEIIKPNRRKFFSYSQVAAGFFCELEPCIGNQFYGREEAPKDAKKEKHGAWSLERVELKAESGWLSTLDARLSTLPFCEF
jgi:hypothetical protein